MPLIELRFGGTHKEAGVARLRMAAFAVATATTLGMLTPVPAMASAGQMAATGQGDQAGEQRAHDIDVYGHRGASGYRPEHTLAAYELAARMGADFIEPDLVPTKDGHLVARHENEIGGTTDVADRPEFADRKTTKVIDGEEVTGWFTEDFTLAELKTLRAKERIPEIRQQNTIYDGRFEVPTFQEVIDLAERLSEELDREIGVAPETKHPSYFRHIDLPVEPRLVEAIERNDLDSSRGGGSKIVVQSFEVSNLQRLDKRVGVPLVQLINSSGAPQDFIESGDPRTYADMVTPKGLDDIAGYADIIGPSNEVLIPLDDQGNTTEPTSVVDDAHQAGLEVVPFTVRAENEFLPTNFQSSQDPTEYGDVFGFVGALYELGVDGIFSDQPDIAVEARD